MASNHDLARLEGVIEDLLVAIGEDPDREGLKDTPRRVAKAYLNEFFKGYQQDPKDLFTTFELEGKSEMVIVRDVPFHSHCEHHLVSIQGTVDVGYLPEKRIVGLSKIGRVVECFASRLQVQERLTQQIADCLMEGLTPKGVVVVVRATHLCMVARGIQKPGSSCVTSAIRGVFEKDLGARKEFFDLIGRKD